MDLLARMYASFMVVLYYAVHNAMKIQHGCGEISPLCAEDQVCMG